MIKRAILFILEIAFILLLLFGLFNSDLVIYGIGQGKGEMKIILNARPIKDVLNDPAVNDSIKHKLIYIEEVKKFAIDSLGLKPSKNYTTFYDQGGKPALWVVTGAEKYALQPYEWRFPVVGKVGYKGFFDVEKAKKAEQQLRAEGYDADVGVVAAWSTLGWFRDPILSGMLRRNEGQLAELIIHEMTHATLYVKSNVDFNENLASFVGEEGALLFLEYKYGKPDSSQSPPLLSKPLLDYIQQKEDYDRFTQHILRGTAQLDSLYHTFTTNTAEQVKADGKRKMITDIVSTLDTIPFHRPEKYIKRSEKDSLPDNTYFLSFTRYDAQKDDMKKEMYKDFNGNFRHYLKYLKMKYK